MLLDVFRNAWPKHGLSGTRLGSDQALMSGVKIRKNLRAESLFDDDLFTFQYVVTVDGEVMSIGPVRLDRR